MWLTVEFVSLMIQVPLHLKRPLSPRVAILYTPTLQSISSNFRGSGTYGFPGESRVKLPTAPVPDRPNLPG